MKKLIIITLGIITLTSCDRVTQTLAIKHNDAIITESDKVVSAFDAVSNSLTSFNADSITISLQKYNSQINQSLQNINTTLALKDSSLKLASIEMIKTFKSVGENEFSKIRDIYTIPDSLYTTTEEKEVTALATAIDEKIETAQNKQRNAQIAFAKKYNFVLMLGKDTIK